MRERPAFHVTRFRLGILMMLLAVVQVAAFRWGVITPDSVDQYQQALTGHYDDWHPPVTAWLWHVIIGMKRGSAGILLFDLALYWAGIALFVDMLLRRNQRLGANLVIAVAALPIPFGQMGALLKDPLLAALCLVASGCIAADGNAGPLRRGVAIFALIVATATRFNAIFATLPLLLALMPNAAFSSWPRRAGTVIAAAVLLIASNAFINVVLLKPHRSEPIFSLVNFDLGGITAQGGGNPYPSLDDAEASRLTGLCYTPRLYNPAGSDQCNAVEDRLAAYAHHHRQPATAIWLRAVSSAPLAYLRHRAAHLNWNWRFLVPFVPADAVYMMSEPNDVGLHFTPDWLTRAIVGAAQAMAWSPLGRPATWLAVALGLLIVSGQLPSRRIVRALAGSALGYGGAYAVVSVAPDLRYNLWTMIAAMIATVLTLADVRAGAKLPRRRAYVAALFVGLVMTAEATCLILGARI